MTSALFALKKGTTDWRLEMSEEIISQKEKFQQEVEQKLLRKELDTELLEDGLLQVKWNGNSLCAVDRNGAVFSVQMIFGTQRRTGSSEPLCKLQRRQRSIFGCWNGHLR